MGAHACERHKERIERKTVFAIVAKTVFLVYESIGLHLVADEEVGRRTELAAGSDVTESVGFGVGEVGSVCGPALRFGAGVGHVASVVPERPVFEVLIDFVAGRPAAGGVGHDGAVVGVAVNGECLVYQGPLHGFAAGGDTFGA